MEKQIQRKLRAGFPLYSSSQQLQNVLYTVILQGTGLERFLITFWAWWYMTRILDLKRDRGRIVPSSRLARTT